MAQRAGGAPAERAAELRNKLVDQCERLQLQSAAIAKHMAEVLPAKSQSVLTAANGARELVIQRLMFVGKVCENEEQRLLENVHAEEERVHQSILTQQAHWTEALQKLDALRTYLVDMITNLDDQGLVRAEKEIFERNTGDQDVRWLSRGTGRCSGTCSEETSSSSANNTGLLARWSKPVPGLVAGEVAEGILEPQESVKLNFNQQCVQSPLLHRLWASAVLSCITGSQEIHIDEKTVSPHLSLSEDKKTLTFSPKKAKLDLDCPDRFDHWPNALATAAFQTGLHAWKINVEKSCAYKLGVCYGSLPRKGSGNEARLGFNAASWVFSRYDKEFRFLHAGQPQPVELIKSPAEIGVLVDFAGGEVLFYDPDSCAILFSHRETFAAPLYPVFAVAHHSISLVQ
ncbi:B box and SPRY domain-containing protein isoform X1 [Cygnus olor]|uniref:B box and SPRY domain-containing protein isoform X1 n=1 Tax=Cygnus olor TaxID=8869 RepID=UPI001ADDF867|nr:B box and SPRY domain-containing protein isoform X1 [Cygnus olor]